MSVCEREREVCGSSVLANPRADTDRECYYQNGSEDQRARVVQSCPRVVWPTKGGALSVTVYEVLQLLS